jgi:hypothetical protein
MSSVFNPPNEVRGNARPQSADKAQPSPDIEVSYRDFDFESYIKELESEEKAETSDNYACDAKVFGKRSLKNLPPFVDNLLFHIEDLHLILRDVYRMNSLYDILCCGKLAYRLITGSNFIADLVSGDLQNYFEIIFSMTQADDEKDSVEKFFESCRDMLTNYDAFTRHPLFAKTYRFMMFCCTRGFLDKFNIKLDLFTYNEFERKKLTSDYRSKADFATCFLDLLLYISETGYAVFKTGSLEPLIYGSTTCDKWYNSGLVLKRQSKFLSNPKPHGFTSPDFFSRLNDAIDKGKALIKFLPKEDRSEKRFLTVMLYDLEMIKSEFITLKAACAERKAPFSILLYGHSSIGKSLFSQILFKHFGKTFSLPIEPHFKYTVNPLANYWDNFETYMWCLQLDDIASLRPDSANGVDPSLETVIQAINNVSFVPDQASLDKKGKTPFQGRLVIATTNTKSLNSFAYFSCPIAVRRRFKFIVKLAIKPEFATNGMLDPVKIPVSDGGYPNFWNIEIEKVVPSDSSIEGQMGKAIEVAKFTDINVFLQWYSREAVSFEGFQDKAVDCDTKLDDIKVCQSCFLNSNICHCYERQAASGVKKTIYDLMFQALLGLRFRFLYGIFKLYIVLVLRRYVPFINKFLIFIYGDNYLYDFMKELEMPFEATQFVLGEICKKVDKKISYPKIICGFIAMVAGSVYLHKLYKSFNKDPVVHKCAKHGKVDKDSCSTCYFNTGYDVGSTSACQKAASASTCQTEQKCRDCYFYTGYELGSMTNHQMDSVKDVGKPPTSTSYEKENMWKDTISSDRFEAPIASRSLCNKSQADIIKLVGNNCVALEMKFKHNDGSERFRRIKAFCLKGNTYITNYHLVEDLMCDVQITLINSTYGKVNSNVKAFMHTSAFRRLPNFTDLCTFRMDGIPPKRDLTKFFGYKPINDGCNGIYVYRSLEGELLAKNIKCLQNFNHPDYRDDTVRGHVIINSDVGDCGSLLVVDTPQGWMLYGFHVAGSDIASTILAIKVLRKDIEDLEFIKKEVESGEMSLSAPGFERKLTSLHHKSPVNYCEQSKCQVYGSFTGFRPKHKSSVETTIIHDALIKRGLSLKHGAPIMNGWEPWYIAYNEMRDPNYEMDLSILDECCDSFITDMLNDFTQEDLSMVHVLDYTTAVNGAPGISFVDSINRSSSMGNPWKKSKKFFLVEKEIPGLQDAVDFTDDIKHRINNIISEYSKGRLVHPNFCAHLKDEAVSFKKIDSKKTRVFTGAPADWSIVVRMFTLGATRLFQHRKFISEMAPGTQCQTSEWDDIYKYLVKHGKDRMVAGDYGKFDKRMSAAVIMRAFRVIIAICKRAGYSEEELQVLECIARDTAYPLIDFNGDLIQFFGSNPSGHPLTVIINSLVNSLYMRYAYKILNPDHTIRSFKNNVSLMTYGDDNIMGVSDKCDWFNHTNIKDVFKSCGIEYTMADKEQASIPFINISDCSFLKRSWRYEADLGLMVCPLEIDSIEKSLLIGVKSKELSREQHSIEKISSAIREYFWHGREIFEEKRKFLIDVVDETNIGLWVTASTFPTWEELIASFIDRDDRLKKRDSRERV